MHLVIYCGTQAEPCHFEIHKYFKGDCCIKNNNWKEWRIPTDGFPIKDPTIMSMIFHIIQERCS